MIEAELRSFITKEKHDELAKLLAPSFVSEDDQETIYFDGPADLRIQANSAYAKVWLKKGLIHDEAREELEVRFKPEDFEVMHQLLAALGYKVKIKWFRHRKEYTWKGAKLCLDYTRGYGHILEIEKMCAEGEKEKVVVWLKGLFAELGVVITSRQEFDSKFAHYSANWLELTKP